MSVDRNSRLSEEMKRVIGNIIQNDLKDPRIPMLTSVTDVEVTRDLRYAKVYVSVFGSDGEKAKCIEGLKSAAGFIRKEVGARIKIRYIPEPVFVLDDSIEHGLHIAELLREVNKE